MDALCFYGEITGRQGDIMGGLLVHKQIRA